MDDESAPTLLEYWEFKQEKNVKNKVNSLLQNFQLKKTDNNEKGKIFEEYNDAPFAQFSQCNPLDNADYVFDTFKNWLAEQHELFLTTYEEPQGDPCGIPHFHTGITPEQKAAKAARREKEQQEQEKLNTFIQDRLKLLNNLLAIYRRVREGKEGQRGEAGRKEHAALASTLVKQMALEYLYIRVHKCRKELKEINPLDPRADEIASVADYTAKVAEKLRCLIEKECDEAGLSNVEGDFSSEIIHDMARMYLSEIERIAICKKSLKLTNLPTTSEITVEKVIGDLSAVADLQEDDGAGGGEGQELELLMAGEGSENIHGEASEPLAVAHNLLQSDSGIESFDAANFLLRLRERMRSVESPYAAEAARAQAFKRRLWALNCFHYYTHNVVPELAGCYKLCHQDDHGSPESKKPQIPTFRMGMAGEALDYGEQSYFMRQECCCDDSYVGSLTPSMVKCECDCDTHVGSESQKSLVDEDGPGTPDRNRFREVIKHFVSYFQDLPEEKSDETTDAAVTSIAEQTEEGVRLEWPKWVALAVGTPEPTAMDEDAIPKCSEEGAKAATFDLSDANRRYLSDKPEILAIVILLLREFFIKRPENNFEIFARDVISNKNFALFLGNYLLATNEGFRQKELPMEPKCCPEENDMEESRRYRFGRSDAEWWKFWGVDCSARKDSKKKKSSSCEANTKNIRMQEVADLAAKAREAAHFAKVAAAWEFPTPKNPCHN